MELTFAKTPTDLEQIADMMGRIFVRKSWFDLYATRMAYQTKDPWYKPEFSRIAKVDGRVVAHVSVVEKRMRVGRSVVRVGGIGDVFTHPEHRKHSFGRLLMEDAVKYMRENDFPLTMLYGIPNYYHKFGYIEAMSAYQIFADVRRLQAGAPEAAAFTIRAAEPADTPRLNALYNDFFARKTGAMVREEAHWYKVFDLNNLAATVAVDAQGGIAGYALHSPARSPEQFVNEIAFSDPAAPRALLAHLAKQAQERLDKELELRLAPDHPAHALLETIGARFVRRVFSEGEGQAMLGTLNAARALESLGEELAARLAASPLAGKSAALSIQNDAAGAAALRWDGRALAIAPAADHSIPSLQIPQTLLTRLLIGHGSLEHLLWRAPGLAPAITPDIAAILRALFPPQHPFTFEADYF